MKLALNPATTTITHITQTTKRKYQHSMAYEEEWETGSGFALDGATGIITECDAGFNNSIGAGVTCVNMTIVDTETGEEMEQSFSVGKNYEANRDGTELVGQGKINVNTNYGILMESVKSVLAAAGEDPGEVIGSSKIMDGWIGTTWTFGTVERETMNPTTQARKMSSKFIVTAYHGRTSEEEIAEVQQTTVPVAKAAPTKAAAGPRKAAPGKVAVKAAPKPTGLPDGIDQELWDSLMALAGDYVEHEDFVNAALDLPKVEASKPAQKAVMGTRVGSVWAAKQALVGAG